MRRLPPLALLAALALAPRVRAASPAEDALDFLAEEAKVHSASLTPRSARLSPATAYVLTAEDIKASGATTLWDLLRAVPGVDVMTTRTSQGEVGVRGLNKPLNNRTLVLLDGKTVLNAFFDFVTWESIPVTLPEIERIEVVEGPVSALYGPNALTGVINIITKRPESLRGGLATYAAGERATQLGSFLYGKEEEKFAYKLGLGWSSANRFEDAGLQASRAGKVHALARFRPSRKDELSVSLGASDHRTQTNMGGRAFDDGTSSFLRADYAGRGARLRAFWNRGRSVFRDLTALGEPNVDYDTVDLQGDRAFALPFKNTLTVGAAYRRNSAQSTALVPGRLVQDLPALFAENEWKPAKAWTFVASGRLDRHPFTGWVLSPRGSVLFDPVPAHLLRLSGGSAFRNPTLTENYLELARTTPVNSPPFTAVNFTILGSRGLVPEKMDFVELAHQGRFGRLKTTAAGFRYRLRDMIAGTPVQFVSLVAPTAVIRQSFTNRGGVDAWGGELSAELALTRALAGFANYSYQSLKDRPDTPSTAVSSPRHKGNAGLRLRSGGWTANVWAHAVDKTYWPLTAGYDKVGGYLLLNAHARYAFSGRWRGLEAGLSCFNLANHPHYELAPSRGGEKIRGRWTGTLSYAF